MARVTITYACGHEGVVELFGRSTDRERRAAWLASDVCPDCAFKARAEKAAKIAAEAEADGLPRLIGSEKQVVWAEQLRKQFFETADKKRADAIAQTEAVRDELSADEIARRNQVVKDWDSGISYIAISKVKASWWIDNKSQNISAIVREAIVDGMLDEAEATLMPEALSHAGIVEVKVDQNRVSAKYPKDDDFRTLVKSMKFRWDHENSRWIRETNQFSGSAEDRAAELVNLLLRNGFSVLCWNEDVRKKAIDATYTEECERWVYRLTAGEYKGWFAISIPNREQALFDAAHRIKDSRIYRSEVVAPAARYADVFDFAECNGYCISDGAKNLANEFISAKENAVRAATKKELPRTNRLEEILRSSDDVIADLVDD